MDNGTKRSIENMISRAKTEVESLNYKINDITKEMLPYINMLAKEISEVEESSARDLNVKVDFNDDTEQLIETINNGLNDVKKRLAEIDFSKDGIINDSSIGITNEVLEKITNAIKSILRKVVIERQQKMNENILKKEKLIERKRILEIEKATLEGEKEGIEEFSKMLKSRKKKEILAEKVVLLEDQIRNAEIGIQQKDFEILALAFKEKDNPQNKEKSSELEIIGELDNQNMTEDNQR